MTHWNTPATQDAYGLVNEAWDYYREIGNEWLLQASTAIADLSSVYIEPLAVDVTYNVDSFLPVFHAPTAPTAPVLPSVQAKTVDEPELDTVSLHQLGDAPAEPDFSQLPLYAPPAPPSQAMPTPPADTTVQLDPIVVPDRPTYTLPDAPTLFALSLPTYTPVVLPEFTGVRPTIDIDLPEDGQLAWTEIAYSSVLQDEMYAKLRDMLQGSLGLPVVVEQAIFDRGRAREDKLSQKQVMEVAEDMAARNLSEPSGILAQRLREVRADNREKTAGLNRELTIATAQMQVENVKFAVSQGMALEQVRVQINQSINERALKAALAVRDYALQRVNALISYANLQQQAYATDAQVWRQQIEGALAALEEFKALIDAQRLIGEINKDLVAQYTAQFQALQVQADLYRSDVEAAKVKGEINSQRIDAAKLLVQRYDAQVTAWGKLQDGYKAQVEGALGTTRFAEMMASIYATRMQGYKTKGDAYFQEGQLALAKNGQVLDKFRALLSGADQELRGQVAQLDAVLRGFGSKVQLYEAQANVATAESAAYDRTTNLKIENERNRTQTALAVAQQRIEQALKIGEVMVEQIKAKAAALAQLAAASQSGVNFGASLSGSLGTNFSYSRSQSWSGEVPDHDASGSGYW